MENLEKLKLFKNIYKDKTVLVTGHTGFKGSWMLAWLTKLQAKTVGYSLSLPTKPCHFPLIETGSTSIMGDIRDFDLLDKVFKDYNPDIVFHLAAQPLVRASFEDPMLTYKTNIIGSLNLLELSRKHNVQAFINVTSDKVYDNKEWVYGYRELDNLGGYDPYSSSKACSEIITNAYRNSFFNKDTYGSFHNTLVASCRAGNVIGGGDWAKDRLIPDVIRSLYEKKNLIIRNPKSTRPWQHVLDPLSGYLLVGEKLLNKEVKFSSSWNFGPNSELDIPVEKMLKYVKSFWDNISYSIEECDKNKHEARLLRLDCSKANSFLEWHPVWDSQVAFNKTFEWYKSYYETSKVKTLDQIEEYTSLAKLNKVKWAE